MIRAGGGAEAERVEIKETGVEREGKLLYAVP